MPAAGYEANLARLFSLRFGWSDVWRHSLQPLGYEVEEIILNSLLLQRTWAEVNGVSADSENWKLEILCAQLADFQPDVVFLDDYAAFSASELRQIKRSASSIRLLVGWCGAPYGSETPFGQFDVVLSNVPSLSAELKTQGCKSEVLRHAFDTRVTVEPPTPERTRKRVTFCGTVSPKKEWHGNRAAYLEKLAKHVPMHIASDLKRQTGRWHGLAAQMALSPAIPKGARDFAEKCLSAYRPFPSPYIAACLAEGLAGRPMYEFLAGSSVTFNMHIGKSSKEASNMRLFEATGVGACLLTDCCGNLSELFEPEYEVVTYAGIEECVEKAQWLLENPEKARQIGLQGQKRVLAEHTFTHRAAEFDAIVKKHLSSASSQIN